MPYIHHPDDLFSIPDMQTSYIAEYPAYHPEAAIIEHLHPLLLNKRITIILGTWCSDCQRELPRFLKVIDHAGFPYDQLTIISVDQEKSPGEEMKEVPNFTKIPVFILTNTDGSELGRITEIPEISLEHDLLALIKK